MFSQERDRPLHRGGIRRERGVRVVGVGAFGQAVPAADDLGGIIEGQFEVVVDHHLLDGRGRSRSSATTSTTTL